MSILAFAEAPLTISSAAPKGKGMQLGRKKNAGAYDQIKDSLGPQAEDSAPLISSAAPTGAPAIATPRASLSGDRQPIHVIVNEALVAELTRDGTVKSYEVKGDLTLRVTDSTLGKISLGLQTDSPEGINFRVHPNVDKVKFNGDRRVQPRDNRSFPANGQSLEVLRWRHAPKGDIDVSDLPISFTVWFNRGSNEDYSMTVEYELQDTEVELRDVTVSIPFGRSEPRVTSDDEIYEVNGDSLDWTIARISADNASGNFEFEGQTEDESEFFPMTVTFSKEKLTVDVDVSCPRFVPVSLNTNDCPRSTTSTWSKRARRWTFQRTPRARASLRSSKRFNIYKTAGGCTRYPVLFEC